jgi:DNA-binding IscR family transcriptional regulator
MAEEEGVPLETVQGTLDRLIREGRVRSETDPGGGEVLAWSAD